MVREIKKEMKKPPGEDYREKSLLIHGLVCALCGREFEDSQRHLLTVHHKDGNHYHNPPDGSNWENLCVYCHEHVHSREMFAEYLADASDSQEDDSVRSQSDSSRNNTPGIGLLGEKLKRALEEKDRK